MFWVTNKYAKVWKIFGVDGKYADMNISTSEKKQDGTYANSSWPARAIGHALQQVKTGKIKEGNTYAITQAKVSNESYKDKDGNWKNNLRLLVMEFGPSGADGQNASQNAKPKATTPTKGVDVSAANDDEEEPW